MNIQRWKGLIWLGSLAVGGYLVYYVYDFLGKREELAREIPSEELMAVLDSVKRPGETKSDVVDYKLVARVLEYDWSGKEKPKPVAVKPGGEPPPVPKVRVETLLKVLAIKVDTTRPQESRAYVKFTDLKLAAHGEKDDTILRPEKRLFAPYQDIRVAAITGEGVVFAFDDGRPNETVATPPLASAGHSDLRVVPVGPEGVIKPQANRGVMDAPADLPVWRPEEITQIRRNEYQAGIKTVEELNRDYSTILSRDINCSSHKDPRTGALDGIKINRVAPNSIPAQAGLTEGEVLKSINGHKVTSVNDAIAYVKANANATDTWTAVFEKQGREFTRTYHSPQR